MLRSARTKRLLASGCCAVAVAACGGGPGPQDGAREDSATGVDVAVDVAPPNAAPSATPPNPTTNPVLPGTCRSTLRVQTEVPVMDSTLDAVGVVVSATVVDDGATPAFASRPLTLVLAQGDRVLGPLASNMEAGPGGVAMTTWNGRIENVPVPTGDYVVRGTYDCGAGLGTVVREAPLRVIRVGALRVSVGDGDGLRIPILWHRLNNVRRNYYLPSATRSVVVRGRGMAADDLSATDGSRRLLPQPFTGLNSPPVDGTGFPVTEDYSQPIALRYGTHPDITMLFTRTESTATLPPMRVRVENATTTGDATIGSGTPVLFRLTNNIAPAVGRYDVNLRVHYEVEQSGGAFADIGNESVPVRVYGLIDDQTISTATTAPYAPWVAVIDQITTWVDGRTTEPDMVAGEIVRHVYNDLSLRYDTANGASFYTRYGTIDYGRARFDLSAFIGRENGRTVNCSDCASIVSTYANMVGCDLGYNIITANFRLHFIRAIGTAAFTNDPFNRGAPGGFRYHAITGPVGRLLTFDATLDEDGDENPAAAPFVELVPDGIARDLYIRHLTPSFVSITHEDKTAID